MKKFKFDRAFAYRFATYLRMSTDAQNPRSPDQQLSTIRNEILRQSLSWIEVESYCDAGVTGKVKSKRLGFTKMLADIKKSILQVDLILVDTYERLGRSEDMAAIVQLLRRSGVLVLDARSHFSDPTTSEGHLMSAIEAWRAHQEYLVKGHTVLRGKRDAFARGLWPGGPVPLGYMLEPAETERRAGREITHNRLTPDPDNQFVVELIFQLADVQKYGATRISRELNNHVAVPASMKPFHANTVNYILSNPIYLGEMVWEQNSADYEDDVRVISPNPVEDWQTVSDYCEPIVDRDRWDRVQLLKFQRSNAMRASRSSPTREFRSGYRGVALKYPLSGLVVCSECGRSMTVCKHNTTESHPGSAPVYRCPRVSTGACSNRSYVDIKWLLDTVIQLLVMRLFLDDGSENRSISPETIQASDLIQDFLRLVDTEVSRQQSVAPSQLTALKSEQQSLHEAQMGWTNSLGNPNLPASLRSALELKYAEAEERLQAISVELTRCSGARAALTANLLSQKSCGIAEPTEFCFEQG